MVNGWVYAPINVWDIIYMYNLWCQVTPLVLFTSQTKFENRNWHTLLYCWCEFYAAKVGCCSFYRALWETIARVWHTKCLSVCLWHLCIVNCHYWRWHALKIITWLITLGTSLVATTSLTNLSLGKFPIFQVKQRWDVKRRFSGWKSKICLKRCDRPRAKVTRKCGYKVVHSLSIGFIFDDVTWPVRVKFHYAIQVADLVSD